MRVRNLLLAAVAIVAIAMPARADVLLGFRLLDPADPNGTGLYPANGNAPISDSYTIADTLPIGPSGITMLPGQDSYIMVTLRSNQTAGTVSPAQAVWYAPFRLTTVGWNLTFDQSVANNPYNTVPPPGNNDNNLLLQAPYGGDVFPQGGAGYPAGYRQHIGLSTAGVRQAGVAGGGGSLAERPLAVFRINAVAGGTTNFVISQLTAGQGGMLQNNLWEVSDNNPANTQYLDTTIFNAANGHLTYSLPVTVVPEPGSMALAGLAFAGLGLRIRKLRKAKATA